MLVSSSRFISKTYSLLSVILTSVQDLVSNFGGIGSYVPNVKHPLTLARVFLSLPVVQFFYIWIFGEISSVLEENI
jgi:hypothetical protein